MNREELEFREKEKKERIALLIRADKLHEVCETCDIKIKNHAEDQNYYMRLCVECPIYAEHRKIGNSLMALSKERKKRNGIQNTAVARRNLGLRLAPNKIAEEGLVTFDELQVDEYYKMKDEGYSDTKIAQKFGVDRNRLIRWKKRNDVERIRQEWKPNIPRLNN